VSDETLLASLTDGVARITLNRPEVRNALSRTMVAELEAALAGFEADPAARVIVLAGAKALRYLRELTTLVFLCDDAREGIAAFFDKRPPEWKGR